MVDFNSYVFSKAAASRILGETVVNTVPDDQYPKVWCWLPKGQKAIAVDKAKFKRNFAEYRRQQGQKMHNAMIDPNDDSLWYVGKYQVTVNPDHLTCTCHDYRTQEKVGIKTPTCKHCYAVLSQLGCNSLAEFIEASASPQPTKVSGEAKTRQSTLNRTKTKLFWATYAQEEQSGRAVPLETAETEFDFPPDEATINQLRKYAHSKGFYLAKIETVSVSAVSEF